MERIGILGGSFDPIHLGHLLLAEGARERLNLSKVLFIPANQSPHKTDTITAAAEHRLAMVRAATKDNRCFEARADEIERGGVSYTVDTITALAEEYGGPDRLLLLVGSDVLGELHTWKEIERVVTLCAIVPVARPSRESLVVSSYGEPRTEREGVYDELRSRIGDERVQAILNRTLEIPVLDVSSTELRRRLRAGETVRYLLPESVEQYIRRERLYGAGSRG